MTLLYISSPLNLYNVSCSMVVYLSCALGARPGSGLGKMLGGIVRNSVASSVLNTAP